MEHAQYVVIMWTLTQLLHEGNEFQVLAQRQDRTFVWSDSSWEAKVLKGWENKDFSK